jgi:hypothetical protein
MSLPLDVWLMMSFSILVFFGVSLWAVVQSLLQEETKMQILRSENALDPYSPRALRDLRAWVEDHPNDPEADIARTRYRDCCEALRSANRHFYDWSRADVDQLESLR